MNAPLFPPVFSPAMTPVFLQVLNRLAIWRGLHSGDALEDDLVEVVYAGCDAQGLAYDLHASLALGYTRACYAIGLIEARKPLTSGEVVVHGERVDALLALIESWKPAKPKAAAEEEEEP